MKKIHEVLAAPETTPERLTRYRKRLRMTQEVFAGHAHLTAGTYRDAEREPEDRVRSLTLRTLEKIEKATGLPVPDWVALADAQDEDSLVERLLEVAREQVLRGAR